MFADKKEAKSGFLLLLTGFLPLLGRAENQVRHPFDSKRGERPRLTAFTRVKLGRPCTNCSELPDTTGFKNPYHRSVLPIINRATKLTHLRNVFLNGAFRFQVPRSTQRLKSAAASTQRRHQAKEIKAFLLVPFLCAQRKGTRLSGRNPTVQGSKGFHPTHKTKK
ncbi:MAG: hypothetical protein AB7F21_09735 [Desulfuromonadales bacterium]